MEADKLFLYTRKESFVPAEFSLLVHWSPILELEKKGTVLVYLQLQTGIVDEEGKSKISVSTIAKRCNLSNPTVYECIAVLEERAFVQKYTESGKKNAYMILELPVAPTESKTQTKETTIPTVEKTEADVAIFSVGMGGHNKRLVDDALAAIAKLYKKDIWNAKDMGTFYRMYYVVAFDGMKPQDKIIMKELGMLKRMIEEYGWEVIQHAIMYALDNWKQMDYVNGYPSITAIYGFRQTIIPESRMGSNKKAARGQHTSSGKTGVGVW